MSNEFTKKTMAALTAAGTPEALAARDKLNELMNLLVESWDAMAAVVKVEHLRMHNISPTLITRIETALEPWCTGEPI